MAGIAHAQCLGDDSRLISAAALADPRILHLQGEVKSRTAPAEQTPTAATMMLAKLHGEGKTTAPGVSTQLFQDDKNTQNTGKSQSKRPHTMWKRPLTNHRRHTSKQPSPSPIPGLPW
jgi:hypothetical protein